MKFVSPGCPSVTRRSETLLYMSTPERSGDNLNAHREQQSRGGNNGDTYGGPQKCAQAKGGHAACCRCKGENKILGWWKTQEIRMSNDGYTTAKLCMCNGKTLHV